MIYLLTASLLLLTVLVIIITIRQRFRTWIVLLIIPFLVFNIGFSYHTVNELWGYAKQGYPREEVELLAYKIEKPDIYVMVREKNGKARLHLIPYTKKTEDDLNGAGREMKKGQRIMMKNRGHDIQESRVEFYSWRPAESMPKEMR